MKLLIIDDDIVDRLSIIRTLQKTELPVAIIDEASDADIGIKMAQSEKYDVILLDFRLSSLTGIEVLTELRASHDFSTSIVMLSHSHDEELALRCIEAGAQDFIMKNEITALRLRRAIVIATERYFLEQKILSTHEQLKRMAEQDSLTGLYNRYFFDETLKKSLLVSSRSRSPLVLLLIDLDRFKEVNDSKGHIIGDSVLKEVAKRLGISCRKSDILCRIGGDEFALILQNLNLETDVHFLVNRLKETFDKPIKINGFIIETTISIGVASYPECATNSIELRKCADIALYRAKNQGRNQVQYYSKEFHNFINHRMRIEDDLKAAIANNELQLYYQPQFDNNLNLAGAEALIRWEHPELGMISPGEFIEIAEESGQIVEIGSWAFKVALEQIEKWTSSHICQPVIAINVSPRQLSDTNLSPTLYALLNKYNVSPSQIELEITESSLIADGIAAQTLNDLSQLGVKIAVDDFGTGYSSLSHLKDFPIDVIKIDKSFIKNIENKASKQLFTAICSFAKSLDYETVAEGVETERQNQICQLLEVTRVQGFKYSKPLPADVFEQKYLRV